MSVNEISAKIRELKELEALIEEAQKEAEAIKDAIKEQMDAEVVDEMAVDVYKVRYKTINSSRFDSSTFKAKYSDLYAQFTKQTASRRFTVA